MLPHSTPGNGSHRIAYTELLGLSDESVMQELVAGNTGAFLVVVKRYHRLLYVVSLRILRDAAEAEDLTQSVFLEVYRKSGQFDSARGALKMWLLQFAYSRSTSRRNYLIPIQSCEHQRVHLIDESTAEEPASNCGRLA